MLLRVLVFFTIGLIFACRPVFGRELKRDIQFQWEAQSGVLKYEVQIASDQNFEKILETKITSKSWLDWSTSSPGVLFWHVRPLKDNHKIEYREFVSVYLSPDHEFILERRVRKPAQVEEASLPLQVVEDYTEPKKVQKREDSPSHFIIPHLGYNFTALNSTDLVTGDTATLLSQYGVRAGADLVYKLSPEQSVFAGLDFEEVAFQPSTNSLKTLTNTTQFLADLSFGGIQKLFFSGEFKYFLAYQDLLFLHGVAGSGATTNIAIDAIPIFSANLEYHQDLFRVNSDHFGFILGGSYFLPSNSDGYTQNAGYSWTAGLEVNTPFEENKNFIVDLQFSQRIQNSSLTNNIQNDIGMNIKINLDFLNSKTSSKP